MKIYNISKKFDVRPSSISHLKGLFAKAGIRKGELIVDVGEKNLNEKVDEEQKIINLNNHIAGYFKTFFKHSCNPNIAILSYNNYDRIKYKALTSINKGAELFLNYNTLIWDGIAEFECHCGYKNCAGRIRGMKYLMESEQNRLLKLALPFIRKKIRSRKDRVDEVGLEIYCKNYENKDMPWEKSARLSFDEALQFIFESKLPKKGKCLEIGVYKGESFLKLIKHFGASNCVGIDLKNCSKLQNVIERDIRKFKNKIPVKLGINDLSWDCPNSKYYAHKWILKNSVKGGLIVLTGYRALDLSKYKDKKLKLVFQNFHVKIFKKIK